MTVSAQQESCISVYCQISLRLPASVMAATSRFQQHSVDGRLHRSATTVPDSDTGLPLVVSRLSMIRKTRSPSWSIHVGGIPGCTAVPETVVRKAEDDGVCRSSSVSDGSRSKCKPCMEDARESRRILEAHRRRSHAVDLHFPQVHAGDLRVA